MLIVTGENIRHKHHTEAQRSEVFSQYLFEVEADTGSKPIHVCASRLWGSQIYCNQSPLVVFISHFISFSFILCT